MVIGVGLGETVDAEREDESESEINVDELVSCILLIIYCLFTGAT